MKHKKFVIKNPFTLKRRFFTKDGKPKEWECEGTGEFTDIETVQRSIHVLKRNHPNHEIEIEFKKDGKLLGFDGKEIGKPIYYGIKG
jgi:hypothetical protein